MFEVEVGFEFKAQATQEKARICSYPIDDNWPFDGQVGVQINLLSRPRCSIVGVRFEHGEVAKCCPSSNRSIVAIGENQECNKGGFIRSKRKFQGRGSPQRQLLCTSYS